MTSKNRWQEWLQRSRERVVERKERSLVEENLLEHKSKAATNGSSRKVVESFIAPPSFILYVWAVFPLLFVSTFQTNVIIAAVIATAVNFAVIHADTFQLLRYVMSGFVLLVLFALYQLNII